MQDIKMQFKGYCGIQIKVRFNYKRMEEKDMDKKDICKKIIETYYKDLSNGTHKSYLNGTIDDKVFEKAVSKYAIGAKKEDALLLLDTSVLAGGGAGYVFTDSKMYCSVMFGKPAKVWYDEIDSMKLTNTEKDKIINIKFRDGYEFALIEFGVDINALYNVLFEFVSLENLLSASDIKLEYDKLVKKYYGAEAGGRQLGTYQVVNKLFEEEKFNARQGHGFAAERANHLYDKLMGKEARLTDRTYNDNKVSNDKIKANAKNGADRYIIEKNGEVTYIQSKYCKTGRACINECFENKGSGKFRYFDTDGNPMKIEVPLDKYDEAVKVMEEKIKNGQVKNVTDPEKAKDIVKKGYFKYGQAVKIARAGTIESLTYDAINGGLVACASAFGVSFAITFATNIWNEDSYDVALKKSTYVGIKVGGTAFLTAVVASQFAKAGLNSALVGGSEFIVQIFGYKAAAIFINAFRSTPIYGAAAAKSAAKLLRGNVITSVAIFVISSSFDIVAIFRGRISSKQLLKNMITNGVTVFAGWVGWVAGAAGGTALAPGLGTKAGGVAGAVALASAAGNITNKLTNNFIEDDAKELLKIIEKVLKEQAEEYLLTKNEVEKVVDGIQVAFNGKCLKDMYASKDREQFALDIIVPLIEYQVNRRKHIQVPDNESVFNTTVAILEDIYDSLDDKDKVKVEVKVN